MKMAENANLIQILQKLGWTGEQITTLFLGVEGRITIEEAEQRIKKETSKGEK